MIGQLSDCFWPIFHRNVVFCLFHSCLNDIAPCAPEFFITLDLKRLIKFIPLIFNLIVPDHNADAFRLPHETEFGSANRIVSNSLSGFSRWDAQYFLHITLYGYTHENTLAFFPLFPLLLRFVTNFVSFFLSSVLSDLNCALIAGVLLNSVLSSMASVFLYKLTLTIFYSEIFACSSALLFCLNPASVFFSALYSEALFSLVTFSGLWSLECEKYFLALSLLSLSAAVRSNGILSVGFLIYAVMKQYIKNRYQIINFSSTTNVVLLLTTVVKIILCVSLFLIPFLLYQTYCYALFCTSLLPESDIPEVVVDYVTRKDLKLPSDPSKWCFRSFPLAYTYVQSRYWDVGFLHYYTFKQIPNFLIASPISIIMILYSIKYFSKNRRRLWHAGLLTYHCNNIPDMYSCSRSFPYFLHAIAVTTFCIFFIHVQVITRILCSSSPVLYWIASTALLPADDHLKFKLMKEHSRDTWLVDNSCLIKKLFFKASLSGKIIFCYFIAYFLVGIFLHVNFLPWT